MLIGGELGARRSHARDFHSRSPFFSLAPRTIYILIRPSVRSFESPSALRQTFSRTVLIDMSHMSKIYIIRAFS